MPRLIPTSNSIMIISEIMSNQAQKVIGRYEEIGGNGDLTVSVTKIYGGSDPYEVLIKRKFRDSEGPRVIHRVVLDRTGPGVSQGANVGLHGEPGVLDTFTDKKIKEIVFEVLPDPDKVKLTVKEFR